MRKICEKKKKELLKQYPNMVIEVSGLNIALAMGATYYMYYSPERYKSEKLENIKEKIKNATPEEIKKNLMGE